MQIDFDEYSDDLIEQDEAPAVEEQKEDPINAILQKLDKFEREIESSRATPQVEPEAKMEEEDDTFGGTYNYDPSLIVSGASKAALKATFTLRKAEDDLRKDFGDKLEPDEIATILTQLASVDDVRQLDDMVNKKGAHRVMAKAMYGDAVLSGRVKPGATKQVTTPIGSESPRESGGNTAISEFERMYGPITSKRMKERLSKIGGVV